MNSKETALCLAELGHETRLQIFRFLVKSGKRQINVGDIQKELNIPNSTLSHHLTKLNEVGLILQDKVGRTIYCTPNFDKLQSIIDFLLEECCEGESCLPSPPKCC